MPAWGLIVDLSPGRPEWVAHGSGYAVLEVGFNLTCTTVRSGLELEKFFVVWTFGTMSSVIP